MNIENRLTNDGNTPIVKLNDKDKKILTMIQIL